MTSQSLVFAIFFGLAKEGLCRHEWDAGDFGDFEPRSVHLDPDIDVETSFNDWHFGMRGPHGRFFRPIHSPRGEGWDFNSMPRWRWLAQGRAPANDFEIFHGESGDDDGDFIVRSPWRRRTRPRHWWRRNYEGRSFGRRRPRHWFAD